MAKKKGKKKPSSKKAVRKASRKLRTKKSVAQKRSKPKTVKVASRKRVKKPLVVKRAAKTAVKKPAQKRPVRPAEPVTTQIVHSAEPQPVPPPVALPPKPVVAVPPALAAPVKPSEAPSERTEMRPTGFHPGQRVRHRYEHWWGTIVEKLANPPGTESAPSPTRYIVTVDGGALRDDIRPEDLTGM